MDITTIAPGMGTGERKTDNSTTGAGNEGNFFEMVKTFLTDSNALHHEAGEKMQSFIAGEAIDIHDVMIARQKAAVSFDMVMELRNKILEAYNELMRTPV